MNRVLVSMQDGLSEPAWFGKIEEYEHNSNSRMQQGRVLDVMEKAASNANGAANGFMGLGMMNMASGGMFGAVQNNAMMNNNGATQQYNPYLLKTLPYPLTILFHLHHVYFCRCYFPYNITPSHPMPL